MKVNSPLRIIAAVAAVIGILQTVDAQNNSPYWSLQGNSNATTSSKLGTLNGVPLKIYAGNNIRMNINNGTGNVAIGNGATASASYRLYVKGAAYGIYGTGTSYGIVGAGGTYGVYGSGTTAGLYGYSSGTYGTYSIGGTYGVYGSGSSYGVYGNGSSYGIFGKSTDGYGGEASSTNSDGFDAYTTNGYYGVYASCSNSGYGVYGYGGYMGLYGYGGTYGSYSTGGTYGAAGYSSSGSGVYGNSYSGDGGYFHSTKGWAVEGRTDSNYYAAVFYGHVYSSGGFITSDGNLKKNIEDFGGAMGIINKLHPKFYEFKEDAKYASLSLPKGRHYGLIAQDLEQVLPNLVHEEKFTVNKTDAPQIVKPKTADGKDPNQYSKMAAADKSETMNVKAVNYEELIPIMIKAMQEQNNKIEALTQQVASLTGAQQAVNNNSAITAKLSSANLGQSTPNPAKNSTSIRYNNLPINANAQLLVYDANGKMMKQIQLNKSGSGSVNIDVSTLSAGRYSYSLLIDGKLIDTKAMEVAR